MAVSCLATQAATAERSPMRVVQQRQRDHQDLTCLDYPTQWIAAEWIVGAPWELSCPRVRSGRAQRMAAGGRRRSVACVRASAAAWASEGVQIRNEIK
eukprot:6180687-Pleurochrysis_carterae.AAC.2